MAAPSVLPSAGFALSAHQRRIWDAYAGTAIPVSRISVRTPPDHDRAAAERRLQELVAGHEILRTRFETIDGFKYPVQAVLEPDERGCANVTLEQEAGVATLRLPAACTDHRSLMLLAGGVLGLGESHTSGAVQYADFAGWQSSLAEEDDEAAHQAAEYWRSGIERLSDVHLPFESRHHHPPGVPSRVRTTIARSSLRQLAALASGAGVTVESVLLALWLEQLHVLAGRAVPCGLVLSGRGADELAYAQGPYACCVPFVPPRGARTLAAFARDVAAQIAAGSRWVHYLEPATAPGVRQPFQFECLEDAPGGLHIAALEHVAEPFRLKLVCQAAHGALHVDVWHDPQRIASSQAERIAGQFTASLEATLRDPDRRAGMRVPLGPREQRLLLKDWNRSAHRFERSGTLPERVERHAAATPDALAVSCGDERISYAALNARANQLARHLAQRGLGRERVAAVLMGRSVNTIVAIIAVLKAGGAFVVIDPAQVPPRRIEHLLRDARAIVTIGEQPRADLGMPDVPDVALDRERDAIAAQPAGDLGLRIHPRQLAYIVYTSGSTGQPKGVMVEHASLTNLGDALWDRVHDHQARVATVNAPLSFDSSIKQLVLLGYGCGLRVVSEAERDDPRALVARLRRGDTAVLDVTPSLLEILVEAGLMSGPRPELVLVAGEPISERLWRQLVGFRGTTFCNLYGPSECTVDATAAVVDGADPVIGAPLANVRTYVLDDRLDLVPAGCPGELCIGGLGVARGYAGDAALTAGRFLPDPYTAVTGTRLYRTGDRARFLENGQLEFLGRVDDQVKVRGVRVEPAEIEAVLAAHPAVARAIVAAADGGSIGRSLVAFVQPREAVGVEQLRAHLAGHLPGYMMPASIRMIESVPLSPRGKVDRPALVAQLAETAQAAVATQPRTETEVRLLEMWRAVLRRDAIGLQDSFFALGGHSLAAMQVAARVLNVFQLDLPLARIFQHPTIEGLARVIDEHRAGR